MIRSRGQKYANAKDTPYTAPDDPMIGAVGVKTSERSAPAMPLVRYNRMKCLPPIRDSTREPKK
jgi:hypothetical protein